MLIQGYYCVHSNEFSLYIIILYVHGRMDLLQYAVYTFMYEARHM